METIKFDFYQEETTLTFEFHLESTLDNDHLKGSVLNELFKWVNIQKHMGAKGLKLSKPINIRIEHGGKFLDTGTAKKQLQQKLKLNTSAKSKRMFAIRFNMLVEYITDGFNIVDVDTVLETL